MRSEKVLLLATRKEIVLLMLLLYIMLKISYSMRNETFSRMFKLLVFMATGCQAPKSVYYPMWRVPRVILRSDMGY